MAAWRTGDFHDTLDHLGNEIVGCEVAARRVIGHAKRLHLIGRKSFAAMTKEADESLRFDLLRCCLRLNRRARAIQLLFDTLGGLGDVADAFFHRLQPGVDPGHSLFEGGNAGSGRNHVATDRRREAGNTLVVLKLAAAAGFQHPAPGQRLRDHHRVKPSANFAAPDFRQDDVFNASLIIAAPEARPVLNARVDRRTHVVGRGKAAHRLEAGRAVQLDKAADGGQGFALFSRFDPAARVEPIAEALRRCPGRFAGLPRQYTEGRRHLTTGSHKGKARHNAAHLSIGIGRAVLGDKLILEAAHHGRDAVEVAGQAIKIGMGSVAEMFTGCRLQMSGEGIGGREAMKGFEDPHAHACICRNIHDADFLPGCRSAAPAILGNLVCKADLSRRKEEGAPAGGAARLTASPGAGLALAVRQHIGDLADFPTIALAHFIEQQERVAVHQRHRFQPVRSCPPCTGKVAPAPYRSGDLKGGRLADRRATAKMEATGFRLSGQQERPGKRGAHRERQPGIANGISGKSLLPSRQLTADAVGIIGQAVALVDDAFGHASCLRRSAGEGQRRARPSRGD